MKYSKLLPGAVAAVACAFSLGNSASAAPVPRPSAALAGAAPVEFDVYLPLQHVDELDQFLAQLHDSKSSQFRHWLTPEQFKARYGASSADLSQLQSTLSARGFRVTGTHTNGVHVAGSAAAVKSAFGADLVHSNARNANPRALVAASPVSVPAALVASGARVMAFTSVPLHHVHLHNLGKVQPDNRYGPDGPYWADDIKQAYQFPSYKAVTGKGRTIAIVMSSDYLEADIAAYFGHEKLTPPKIKRINVCADGICGGPFDLNNGASVETALDLQQSGAIAPGALLKLYNLAELSDDAIMTAYQMIVDTNAADIVSSSFGGPELLYTKKYNEGVDYTYILQQYEDIFRQGNAQGITFVASSGDEGGVPTPSVNYFYPNKRKPVFVADVESPADSPRVTGIGGTNLVTTAKTGSLDSIYIKENANPDPLLPFDPYGFGQDVSGGFWGPGGGESRVFQKPLYQYLVKTGSGMRTVPDISLQMGGCPADGPVLPCPLDGTDRSASIVAYGFGTEAEGYYGVIGTSIGAPEFAGLLALYEEHLGGVRLGNVNTQIYALAAVQALIPPGLQNKTTVIYHQSIPGFNGVEYSGNRGYNQVIGVGTPNVNNFMLWPNAPLAGTPQTPSNP